MTLGGAASNCLIGVQMIREALNCLELLFFVVKSTFIRYYVFTKKRQGVVGFYF